jgi:hypothetical protein
MRNNKEFDSLENWADRNSEKTQILTVAPQGFLDGVMDKVHTPACYLLVRQRNPRY